MKKTAILVIGDEILSGRTHDTNSHFLAIELGKLGLPVGEIRTVADDEPQIVHALKELRHKYKYVFTTGGIGPTHDDITAAAVAAAFGVPVIDNPDAVARLENYYAERGGLNAARRRMAQTPEGARLIENAVTVAPGFCMENVFVLAGVPNIMQAMFKALIPILETGAPVLAKGLVCHVPEGELAAGFEALSKKYKDLSFGSYPSQMAGSPGWTVTLIVRGYDAAILAKAFDELVILIKDLGGNPEVLDKV